MFLSLVTSYLLTFGSPSIPFTVEAVKGTGDVFAEVTVKNVLTAMEDYEEGYLIIDDMEILVIVESGNYRVPDTVYVIPPPGLVAVPPEVTLQEGETGKILIMKLPMG